MELDSTSSPSTSREDGTTDCRDTTSSGLVSHSNCLTSFVFRHLCGLKKATSFADLDDVLTEEQISGLSSVYTHVDDVDLYIAGLMETPLSGSLLGPTLSCIIADQVRTVFVYWVSYDKIDAVINGEKALNSSIIVYVYGMYNIFTTVSSSKLN